MTTPQEARSAARWLRASSFTRGPIEDAAAMLTEYADMLERQAQPVAWYVERVAPGKRDHGMRLGPFWKREDAEEWADDRHVLQCLYAAPPAAPKEPK